MKRKRTRKETRRRKRRRRRQKRRRRRRRRKMRRRRWKRHTMRKRKRNTCAKFKCSSTFKLLRVISKTGAAKQMPSYHHAASHDQTR